MADWISQYTAALDERDAREKAHKVYIDAYTKLADRTAALESVPAQTPPPPHTTASPPPPPAAVATGSPRLGGWGTPSRVKSPAVGTTTAATAAATIASTGAGASPDMLARLRADLATTQRSRAELQTSLAQRDSELASLSAQRQTAARQTEALAREKRDLERRLRDRDEEVRQKQRLVENVHDEIAGLNLELNMAEQRADRFKAENEMLVKRWMDKMGEEAEKMNEESKWQ